MIRHGETDANKLFVVQGRMDNPLNDHGREQAHQTGTFLRENNLHFDVIVSSPLKRAYETATIICKELRDQKAVLAQAGFMERNFGDFDGRKIDDEYANLVTNDAIHGMEKNKDLERRVFDNLNQIVERYPDKTILLITHSHVIKSVLVNLVKDFTYTSYLFNCSISVLTHDQGTYKVIDYNINPLK